MKATNSTQVQTVCSLSSAGYYAGKGHKLAHKYLIFLFVCLLSGVAFVVQGQAQTVTGSNLNINNSSSGVLGTFSSSSTGWNEIQVSNQSGGTTTTAQIKVEGGQVEIGARSNSTLSLSAGDNRNHLLITTAGNVGIGINPSTKLDVNGASYMRGHISFRGTAGTGLRFWNNDNYKIHMGNATEYKYGPVNDYSIKMNMSNNAGRGWVWGVHGQVPVAALNTLGNMKIKGLLEAEGGFKGDGSQLTGTQGNFGQFNSHSTYQDFNATVTDWGWNYVLGSANGPNNTSAQWYRFIGSLGSEYGINQYRLEIAYPRYNAATAGVWMRTMENGALQPWVQINGGGGASLSDITSKDGKTYQFGAAQNATTGISVRTTSNPATGDNIFTVEPSGGETRFGVTQSAGGWFRDGLSVGVQYDGAMPDMNDGLYVGGNVTFGQATAKKKLTMHGDIVASRIAVASDPANFSAWPDYVFAQDYDLRSLEEVEAYIKAESHLPEVPSAEEVATGGFDLGNMDATLLKKVEELTLYIIEQNKKLEKQNQRISELEARITDQD